MRRGGTRLGAAYVALHACSALPPRRPDRALVALRRRAGRRGSLRYRERGGASGLAPADGAGGRPGWRSGGCLAGGVIAWMKPSSRSGALPLDPRRAARSRLWCVLMTGRPRRWGPPRPGRRASRTIVALVLASDFPMVALWGPELIQIYNDGYAAIMGGATRRAWASPRRRAGPRSGTSTRPSTSASGRARPSPSRTRSTPSPATACAGRLVHAVLQPAAGTRRAPWPASL